MKTAITFGLSLAALSCAIASPAMAQSGGVVVMRKVIQTRVDNALLPPSLATPTPTMTPSATPTLSPDDPNYYSWTVTGWSQSADSCGSTGTETRNVACKNSDGLVASDSLCVGNGSGQKPVSSQPATITTSCTYAWQATDWPAPAASCGSTVQGRTVTCLRSDGTPSGECPAATMPAELRSVSDFSACSYGWSADAWSAPSNACGANTDTRTVSCRRSDGSVVDDTLCASAGAKPATTQDDYQATGCAAHWTTGEWGSPAPACGGSTSARTVQCVRADGASMDDASCTDPKPATSRAATDYSTCAAIGDPRTASQPYDWTTGPYGPPSATCGAATQTRTVQCLDGSGATVSDSLCAGMKPSGTLSSHETSGCTAAWSAGDFAPPQPGCGETTHTRSVSCVRSDGVPVADGNCPDPEPSSTQTTTDYSACTFGWTASEWSALATTCGDATQTRTVACQRSDGTAAPDGSCDSRTRPEDSQTSYQTSGCGFTWKPGAWSDPAPACGSTGETRLVACVRSDGQTVDDGQCSAAGAKPATSQATNDYSACTFSWAVGTYSPVTTTCGTSTQTRTVGCLRSDGQTVADDACSAAGAKPDTSQSTQQTSGCTYGWSASDYGSAVPSCGASTHSRTVSCVRSDGTTADASNCSGTAPATSEATTDYSTCSYAWNVSSWNGGGGCGASVTQTRSVACLRSDTATVADANCTATKPAASQIITDYSACSYSWRSVAGTWSGTCSATATRPETVTCMRQDGATVDDGFCTTTKPATTDTGNYAGCTYAPTYGGYGNCVPTTLGGTTGIETAGVATCTRSDGTVVASSNCTPQTKTTSCTVTYVGTYGTCTASTAGSTSGSETLQNCAMVDSIGRSQVASYGYCSKTKSCTLTYAANYGSTYGSCILGSQAAQISSCTQTASDETTATVANSYCSTANAPTRACTNTQYATCTTAANTFLTQSGGLPNPIGFTATSVTDARNKAATICQDTSGVKGCMLSTNSGLYNVYVFTSPISTYTGTSYAAYYSGSCILQ